MATYEKDKDIQFFVFGAADMEDFSAQQVTELVAEDFIRNADEHAEFYLA